MCSIGDLIITQTCKQETLLKEQSDKYPEWFIDDQKLIDNFIINESFTLGSVSNQWEGVLIKIIDNRVKLKGKWENFSGMCANGGLFIGNRMIKCKSPLNLRSLSLDINIDLQISNSCEMWVLTRGQDFKDPDACILKLRKESELEGTFIAFGAPIGKNNDFVFFKRQQIPENRIERGTEQTNMKICIKDNGDDRVYVTTQMVTFSSVGFQTFCNKFLPSFADSNLVIAGIGSNILIKQISVQYKPRIPQGIRTVSSTRHQCCTII